MKIPPLVTVDHGPRPAGPADECFYCQQKIGTPHTEKCVMFEKTVIVKMTVSYPIKVPNHWGPEDVEFHRNNSSWCSGNAINELQQFIEDTGCGCGTIKFAYVGEAQ